MRNVLEIDCCCEGPSQRASTSGARCLITPTDSDGSQETNCISVVLATRPLAEESTTERITGGNSGK